MLSPLARFGTALCGSTSNQQFAPVCVAVRRSPTVRATRPSAVGEPGLFGHGKKYGELCCISTQMVAAVAGAGLSTSSLASRKARFSSGKQPKSKHNTVMAFPLRHRPCFAGTGVSVQAHILSSRFVTAALPNPSVELTNCGKPQFAAHLER
jgi:hypothetical protein